MATQTELAMGLDGFDRLEGAGPHAGRWYALKATNGDVTFAAGCAVEAGTGDAPAPGDVLKQGDVLQGRFRRLALGAGNVLYAYPEDRQ